MKNIGYIIALLFTLALGIFIAKWWYGDAERTKQESQVLLQQVQNVSKLVTVEGHFAEIFSEENTQLYFGIPSTKRILIKVNAKVSAGYNLEGLKIEADAATKTLHISNLPPPEIISIEPDITYYDITNGIFNQFSKDDYNRLNQKSVQIIRDQVAKSGLMENVKGQGLKNFDALRLLTESMGWKFEMNTEGLKN